jgi:hypothetical protein
MNVIKNKYFKITNIKELEKYDSNLFLLYFVGILLFLKLKELVFLSNIPAIVSH